MIRNAVIHISNEQPLLADLFDVPKAGDQGLICTNVRTMDGRRPIFIDHSDSVFFFPYLHIRFVEFAAAQAADVPQLEAPVPVGVAAPAAPPAEEAAGDADLELDEDFLRRIREV